MMKKITLIINVLIVLSICLCAQAQEITQVEVGQNVGCNLTPVFVGKENFYEIASSRNDITNIVFGLSQESARILRVEANQKSIFQTISTDLSDKGWQYALFSLNGPFNAKIFYLPIKPGLMKFYVYTSGNQPIQGIVWIMAVPLSHNQYDVNWDGEVNANDISAVKKQIQKPTFDIVYWRCDVNNDGIVDKEDLSKIQMSLTAAPAKKEFKTMPWGSIKTKGVGQ